MRYPTAIFFIHEIFRLDARAVKRFRGFVADFMLVDVYSIRASDLIVYEHKIVRGLECAS